MEPTWFTDMRPNELRIRVARSRDTILGWTKSGAPRLLLEFQRASACREEARREPFGGLDVRSDDGPRPRVNADARIATRRTARNPSARQTAPQRTASARADERATSGEDTVMAHASVAERGRPPGSRSPFDTADNASAADRQRPVPATAGWTPARWAPVAETVRSARA